jgi:hypothetical protein
METYKAQAAEVTIDGDVMIFTKKKIGKDDVRRIPLAAVTDHEERTGAEPALRSDRQARQRRRHRLLADTLRDAVRQASTPRPPPRRPMT